jgi:predicted esterase
MEGNDASGAAHPGGFFELAVPGFLPAVVWMPPSRERVYPLLVATHGAGGVPEADCEEWKYWVGTRAFILCPRGKGIVASGAWGYYYPDHHALDREVVAAVDALRAAPTGARVDTDRAVYTGFSQGATMGALMMRAQGARFPRLVLVEGGFAEWTVGIARKYRAAGGERVLLVCGTNGCATRARRSAEWLTRAGLEAIAEHAQGAGHTTGGPVADAIGRRLDWVLEGDARWSVR